MGDEDGREEMRGGEMLKDVFEAEGRGDMYNPIQPSIPSPQYVNVLGEWKIHAE